MKFRVHTNNRFGTFKNIRGRHFSGIGKPVLQQRRNYKGLSISAQYILNSFNKALESLTARAKVNRMIKKRKMA